MVPYAKCQTTLVLALIGNKREEVSASNGFVHDLEKMRTCLLGGAMHQKRQQDACLLSILHLAYEVTRDCHVVSLLEAGPNALGHCYENLALALVHLMAAQDDESTICYLPWAHTRHYVSTPPSYGLMG